jgi:cytosine deaminase
MRDVAVGADGRIAAVGPALPTMPGGEVIEAAGRLVVPGLVDVHQHLDKALTRASIANPDGTLAGAVAAFRDHAARLTGEEIAVRAERTIARCLERGTIAIRTHANVDPELECRSVSALVDLRERLRDRITLQVVAFVTAGATRAGSNAAALLEQAVALGADVVGGAPHIADDPPTFLDLLFAAAERHALPVDLHLDEHLDAGRQLFDAVIERTQRHGLAGRVAIGHCCALSAMAPDEASRIIDRLREAGIAVITLPAANLYLQGRNAARLPPRGLTRVRELVEAGVVVATASDNIEDSFIPVGSGDLLETARWTLLAGHLGSNDLATAFAMVTAAPAAIMGLEADYGIRPGARADLIITTAEDAEDLVASGPSPCGVFVGGRRVAGPARAWV